MGRKSRKRLVTLQVGTSLVSASYLTLLFKVNLQ
jgi:hypothetical protein